MFYVDSTTLSGYCSHALEVEASLRLKVDFERALYDDLEFLFLCFTNRCGSNFVAETLASNGSLNVASEWWNGGEILRVCRDQKLEDFGQYFNGTCRYNMRNGRLISKLAVENLVLLHSSGFFDSPDLRCRFLIVERSDRLDQAISLVLAQETSAWAFNNPPTKARSDVAYDRSKVDACLSAIDDQTARLWAFFELNSIVPIQISYEAFVEDPSYQTGVVGRQLGIPALSSIQANVNVRKQADETNLEWRSRYTGLATNAR